MLKGNITKKTLSVLLSALMVITMVPAIGFASLAADSAASRPASTDGVWNHKTVESGSNAGWGQYFVTMSMNGVDFVCMQTKDNEVFALTTEFSAMKNDGINSVLLNKIDFHSSSDTHFVPTSQTWKSTTSNFGNDDYSSSALPGAIGSGHSNQVNKNIAKWNWTFEFTANGSAVYYPVADIVYESGAVTFNRTTHSTEADGELVKFTVTVVDLRDLLSAIEYAKSVCADETADESYKKTITAFLDDIDKNYNFDGTTVYSQETINDLKNSLENITRADYTQYLKAVSEAEKVLNNSAYTASQKEVISNVLKNKDAVLNTSIAHQDIVDNQTQNILDAIDSIGESLGEMNSVSSGNSAQTTFNFSAVWSGCNTANDSVAITLSQKTLYMDITEDIAAAGGLTYSFLTNFSSSNQQYTGGPFANVSTTNNVAGTANKYNYNNYFTDFGLLDANTTVDETKTTSGTAFVYSLDGKPVKTTADNEKAYLGLYWRFYKPDTAFFGNNSYTKYSYDSASFSIDSDQPYVELNIYDKAPLEQAILNARKTIHNESTNYADYVKLIEDAQTAYVTREVLPSTVLSLTEQLNNFVFTYSVDVDVNPAGGGNIGVNVLSGQNVSGNLYSESSVLSLTATPCADYDFDEWSDGVKDAYREVTVTANTSYTANFIFVLADYSKLENALADIPEDLSSFSQETAAALKAAAENAQAVIDAGYGKSNQSAVDMATESVNAAVENLVKVVFNPCDYSPLDEAIKAAETVPSVNDGRYTQTDWDNFRSALDAANSIDRNLTDENDENQQLIIDAAISLGEAMATMNQNKNFVVDVNGENGELITSVVVDKNAQTSFGDIKDKITEPETDDNHKFAGWEDENGNIITDDTVITDDIVIKPIIELSKITPNSNGNKVTIDRDTQYTYLVGLNAEANTVADLKASLVNDSVQIIVTRNEQVLSDNDLVGTGCVVKCVSKINPSVIYEQATVILYGDVNGDGLIDNVDHSIIKANAFLGDTTLVAGTVYYFAADLDGDGVLDGFDYFIHEKEIAGTSSIDQSVILYK